jgi:hypothetical protein
MYSFDTIGTEIKNMLVESVYYNTNLFVKKREFAVSSVPQSYDIVELQKQIQDTLDSITTITETVQKVFNPQDVDYSFDDPTKTKIPIDDEVIPLPPRRFPRPITPRLPLDDSDREIIRKSKPLPPSDIIDNTVRFD